MYMRAQLALHNASASASNALQWWLIMFEVAVGAAHARDIYRCMLEQVHVITVHLLLQCEELYVQKRNERTNRHPLPVTQPLCMYVVCHIISCHVQRCERSHRT